MTQPPDDRPRIPPPLRYARQLPEVNRASVVQQFFIGMAVAVAVIVGIIFFVDYVSSYSGIYAPFLTGSVIFLVLFVYSVYLSRRHGWGGFLPGVLLAMALSCLIPIGIIKMVCGNFGR